MAKSKVSKGFLYYILMFALLLFGVFCIFASILIFNPGEDIYGIGLRYISHHNSKEYFKLTNSDIEIDNSVFDTVVFNGENSNFKIDYDDSANFVHVRFKPNVTALSKSDNWDFKISITLDGATLKINVEDPELWLPFSNKTIVSLVCPKNHNFSNVAFNITTTTGSVVFGNKSDDTYEIRDLDIRSKSGEVAIYKNINIASQTIDIISEQSRISLNSNITGQTNIENSKGSLKIGTLRSNLNIENNGRLEADCNTIVGNVSVKSKDGFIKIKNLGENFSNGNFTTIDNIDGTNVIISKMTGNASIATNAGYVSIDTLAGQALIQTVSGNVEIKNASKQVDIITKSGNVTVTQLGENVRTTITTESGKIVSNFINIGNVTLLTEKSNIEINVKTGVPFVLNYETSKGLTASWSTIDYENVGTIFVSGATDSSTSIINATSSNGSISVKEGFEI